MEDLIRVTPNQEKAKSMIKMAETTLEMVKGIDQNKFPSNLTKEYYDLVRELMGVVLLLDGYKTIGEGAHKRLVKYLEDNYKQFEKNEINLINDLRIKRNKIAYDGFFVTEDYLQRKTKDIHSIIFKLKDIVEQKLND